MTNPPFRVSDVKTCRRQSRWLQDWRGLTLVSYDTG